jgi:hypothetical protein
VLFPAILVYAFMIFVAIRIGRVEEADPTDRGQIWVYEHLWQPILRALAIGALIMTAYPALFDTARQLPEFSQVLSGSGHTGIFLDLLFVSSIALPFIPVLGRQPALILPVQTAIACALVFAWLCRAIGIDASLWPSWGVIFTFVALATAGHFGGNSLMQYFGEDPDGGDGSEWYEAAVLIVQLPAVLIYTHSLGTQLHP